MKPTSLGDLPKEEPTSQNETNQESSVKIEIDENEKRLLYQEFLMKPNTRVLDFLNEHKAEIIDFMRVECGEKIENEPQ